MATRSSRNNVLAGIFVLISIMLGMAVVVVLSDLGERLTPMNRYFVRFSLADGAEGLRSGSLVKIGGQPVGRVLGWRFAMTNGEPTAVDVEVKVRADVALYQDATVLLVVPLLGTNSQINIPDVGGPTRTPTTPPGAAATPPQAAAPRLQPGQVVEGQLAPPGFLAQAGYGEEQRAQLQAMLRNLSSASERIDNLVSRVDGQIEPTMSQVRDVLADAKAITGDAREAWPRWREQIDASLAGIESASARLTAVVDSVHDGVRDARAMIADNRPRIDSTLANIEELSAKFNTDGWEMVQATFARAQRGLDEFAETANRLNALSAESAPEVRTLVANARLASDQLKLTAAEVRAAPWKLLARPTGRRELENEALYDAARQYALAVSDLRAASTSLESVSASAERLQRTTALDRNQIDRLVRDLEFAFQRYQAAEREFLSRLVGPPPAGR